MRRRISLRDFGTGVIVGLVVGSVGLAGASFRYEGWARFSSDFKLGYINGFLDMANLARNLEPGGYVDSKYPQVEKAKPAEWAMVIDRLYKDPENQRYRIASMMQYAADELEKKYGKSMSADERVRRRMETQLALIKKKQEAAGLKEGAKPPAPPKAVVAPEKSVAKPVVKKPRKWCRCDGKNPKAERAKRRAAAAAAAAAQGGDAAKPAPEPAKAPADAAKPPEPAKP
jgi:hypothetical protein